MGRISWQTVSSLEMLVVLQRHKYLLKAFLAEACFGLSRRCVCFPLSFSLNFKLAWLRIYTAVLQNGREGQVTVPLVAVCVYDRYSCICLVVVLRKTFVFRGARRDESRFRPGRGSGLFFATRLGFAPVTVLQHALEASLSCFLGPTLFCPWQLMITPMQDR